MVSGNQIIYPKQNDNIKVNERLVRNKNLQRTSTLEMVMVFLLALLLSMSIFLVFDILTIREQLNFPDRLDRFELLDMSDFNDDYKFNHNEKPDSLGSSASRGSPLFPSAKRKPAHLRNILSGGFKTTQPFDVKTITLPNYDSPTSTNVTRKSSLWILKLHPSKFYQVSTFKDKDSGLSNTGETSLIPFDFNRYNPYDTKSRFKSIIRSVKATNDSKSKLSGNSVIHPTNSTQLHERNHTKLQRKQKMVKY